MGNRENRPTWSQRREFERQLTFELERMLVLGLVEIVGKNDSGQDLFAMTEKGKLAVAAFQAVGEPTEERDA